MNSLVITAAVFRKPGNVILTMIAEMDLMKKKASIVVRDFFRLSGACHEKTYLKIFVVVIPKEEWAPFFWYGTDF